tara:strand:- start:176 stop:469 length:294 start_codon:yes stop_codon:yes gene_type:complete
MAVYSNAELRDTISVYFDWLEADKRGDKILKTAKYRQLIEKYNGVRSKGSYESKMQNISAVVVALGLPHVKGLKPRGHGGATVRAMVTGMAKERGLI